MDYVGEGIVSGKGIFYSQDLRIPAISVGAIRESPLHLGLNKEICVSPKSVSKNKNNKIIYMLYGK